MKKVVFAGATAFFGWKEISEILLSQGFEAIFIDADFMKPFYDEKEGICTFYSAGEINECLFSQSTVIPLTEFWISQCIKFPAICRISENALKSSRSKQFFHGIMTKNKIPVPKLYSAESEAKDAVLNGSEIIIKPDSLNSGYGVEVINESNLEKFEKFVFQTRNLKNHALKIFQVENTGILFSEKINGSEFSADCFISNGKIKIVRICRKYISVVHDKPCCLAVQILEKEDEDFRNASPELIKWCSALFDCTENGDISFAQFDFIKKTENTLNSLPVFVPIDFAPRIGGGMKDLFSEYKKLRLENVYAVPFSDVSENPGSRKSPETRITQLNYLPSYSDYVTDDSYIKNLHSGKQIIFKKKGDYVTSNPTSVSSRMAIVITGLSPFDLENPDESLRLPFDPQSLIIKQNIV